MRTILALATAAILAPAGVAIGESDLPLDLTGIAGRIDAGDARAVISDLRARPLDAGVRCGLGLAYAGPTGSRGHRTAHADKLDRARAILYLAACDDAHPPDDIAARAAEARGRLLHAADAAGDTRVEVVSRPAGMVVSLDALAGDPVIAPATLWLPAGSYRFTTELADRTTLISDQSIRARSSATVLFVQPAAPASKVAPKTLDFSEGEPETAYAGAPPKQTMPSMLPDRFQKGLDASKVHWVDIYPPPRRPANHRVTGLRAGAAIVDSATGGSIGVVAGVIHREPIATGLAFEGRLDVTDRFDDRTDDSPGVWTIGLGAAARWWLITGGSARLSVAGGVRGEVRHLHGGASDLGATVGGGIAVELWRQGASVEVRGEQGLTALAGTRPRDLVLELGFDL